MIYSCAIFSCGNIWPPSQSIPLPFSKMINKLSQPPAANQQNHPSKKNQLWPFGGTEERQQKGQSFSGFLTNTRRHLADGNYAPVFSKVHSNDENVLAK
jgi:hypothetical protein